MIGASTFAILLIHANSGLTIEFIWYKCFRCVEHYNDNLINLLLYSIGIVIAVFVVCSIIDILRIKIIEKNFFKWYDSRQRFVHAIKYLQNIKI